MGKKSQRTAPPASAAFSAREMAAMVGAREQAARGTPGIVRDALLGQPIVIGKVTLPVIMLGHVLLLEKIDSPFVKAGELKEPTNLQVTEALYVLNTPAAEVLRLLRAGRAMFDEAVLSFAQSTVPLAHMREIGAALGAQLLAASAPAVGTQDSPASSGEGTGAASVEKKSAAGAAPVTSPQQHLPRSPTASAGS